MNVTIDIKTNDYYLRGHSICGNLFFPGTGYVMLAWCHLAACLGRTWSEVPVVFENVQFKRAVILSEKKATQLKVRYFQNTGDFVILENGVECVIGKIHSQFDGLMIQSIIYEKENCVLTNEFSLGEDDIYKDMRIMGYEYSGQFRNLRNIRTNDFKEIIGVCEWNGNMVTFLDSLLHSTILTAPLRKTIVPVMIKTMRIDPKVFFNSIVEKRSDKTISQTQINTTSGAHIWPLNTPFCSFKSELPFYLNSKTNLIITHGIEIENLMSSYISGKVDSGNPIMDTYEFIANEDLMAIDPYNKQKLMDYIQICKSMATKVEQIALKIVESDFTHPNISLELLEEYRNKNDENHVIFKFFDKIYQYIINYQKSTPGKIFKEEIENILIELKSSDRIALEKDVINNNVSKNERLIRSLTDLVNENNGTKDFIKVTEINFSSDLLIQTIKNQMQFFRIQKTQIQYTLVVKYSQMVNNKSTEQSQVCHYNQELQIEQSDLVILRDTPELWELCLEQLMTQIADAIVDNGFLLVVCKYQYTEPELCVHSILDPDQLFDSLNLEKRIKQIIETCKQKGMALICRKHDSITTMALLFRKCEKNVKAPGNNQIIEITAEPNEQWFQNLKEKTFFTEQTEEKSRIWLIARDTHINGTIGMVNCLRLERKGGENVRCIFDFDHSIELPIDWNSKPFSDILRNDLVMNVIKGGKLGSYRHLKLSEDYDKTVSNEYFLNFNKSKDLSSLQWFDGRSIVANKEYYDVNNIKKAQVPVQIYSSGLTYDDATGRIRPDPKSLFTDCHIGCEYAGRRADTGQRVMGFEMSRCFATSINANLDLMTSIPAHWTMDDSITILNAYSRAWYSLIEKAQLRIGESILIHSGAGGVGQAAINICQHYNCKIFVAVATDEQKHFLIEKYNIPEDRIFSSTDVQFKYKIIEITEGKGVDIVLNSLAVNFLDSNFDCVANGGRFIELRNSGQTRKKQLAIPDVFQNICFIAVDIYFMNCSNSSTKFFDWMHKNCRNGCVKPLPRVIFNANEAKKAFIYMTTGKDIGKIVIRIRNEEQNGDHLSEIKSSPEMIVTTKTYFNPNKVYIITGGLGGLGIELVIWMLHNGARKFVLTSRSGLKTDYQKYVINRLKMLGQLNKFLNVNIHISINDCLSIESTRQVLNDAKQLGQIGAVFHLTVVLNDRLFKNITFESFCQTIDSKYKVFYNLDVECRKLDYNLDYFVVLSSIACGKGNAGQTNYALGNSLCERICEQRRKDGLHALAIQYGPIADVGVVDSHIQQKLLQTILKIQKIGSCFDVLGKMLCQQKPIISSYVISE